MGVDKLLPNLVLGSLKRKEPSFSLVIFLVIFIWVELFLARESLQTFQGSEKLWTCLPVYGTVKGE